MNERMDPLIQPSHSRFFAKPSIGKMIKENPVLGANPFYAGMLSGMAAGCVSASAIYPLDVVRLRLTTTPGLYKGVLDGFRTIAAKEYYVAAGVDAELDECVRPETSRRARG